MVTAKTMNIFSLRTERAMRVRARAEDGAIL